MPVQRFFAITSQYRWPTSQLVKIGGKLTYFIELIPASSKLYCMVYTKFLIPASLKVYKQHCLVHEMEHCLRSPMKALQSKYRLLWPYWICEKNMDINGLKEDCQGTNLETQPKDRAEWNLVTYSTMGTCSDNVHGIRWRGLSPDLIYAHRNRHLRACARRQPYRNLCARADL